MRRLLAVVVVAVVASPASSATTVDPRAFVLHQADVPAGYLFDEDNSILLPKALAATAPGEAGRVLRRSGFQAGYFARYLNSGPPRWRYVDSGAYVFRRPGGARSFLPLLTRSGLAPAGERGRRIDLGDEAWMYTSGTRQTGTSVVWRHGRVLAWVSCRQMTRHRTLTLAQARKQQRRIAAELR